MDAKSQNIPEQANVVLLHGLGRSPSIMNKMASYLSQSAYNIFNIDYPSKQYPIQQLSEIVYQQIKHLYELDAPLHFVGHSMGGIIIRYLLTQHRPRNLGRVVMLASPNHGSRVINWLRKIWLFRKYYGPGALQLAEGKQGLYNQLPPVDYETGVIAGDIAIDVLFWFFLKKPNDGKVTVKSTHVEGMKDHIVLPVAHPFTPQNKHVRKQTREFLERGEFKIRV